MRPKGGKSNVGAFLWDMLVFERLLTGPVLRLIYWAGLGVIGLMGFSIIGAVVGLAIREDLLGILLAFAALVAGFLVLAALVLIWRAFCEFYVAIFRISEDLRALRQANDAAPLRGPPPSV